MQCRQQPMLEPRRRVPVRPADPARPVEKSPESGAQRVKGNVEQPSAAPVEAKSPPLVPIIAAAQLIDLNQSRIDGLLAQAAQRIESGDIAGAREMLAGADDGEQGALSFALAETYDPNMLAAWGTRGVAADAAKARAPYGNAFGLGVARAQTVSTRCAPEPPRTRPGAGTACSAVSEALENFGRPIGAFTSACCCWSGEVSKHWRRASTRSDGLHPSICNSRADCVAVVLPGRRSAIRAHCLSVSSYRLAMRRANLAWTVFWPSCPIYPVVPVRGGNATSINCLPPRSCQLRRERCQALPR